MNWHCYYSEVVSNLSILSFVILFILFLIIFWITVNTLLDKETQKITDNQIEINIKFGYKIFLCMIPFILFLVFSPSGQMFKTLCELPK